MVDHENASFRLTRRQLLQGAAAGGLAGAGLLGSGSAVGAASRRSKTPKVKGLGPGGSLLPPTSRPFPHLAEGTDSIPDIEHIVVLMMENHSFDDHLGMLGRGDGFTLGADGTPINYNPYKDQYVRAYHLPSTQTPGNASISQSWDTSHLCWDNGTCMGFANNCGPASMGYSTAEDFPFYYSMASQFPIGDRYFCSVMAQTYPNRRFLIAATALGDVSTNSSGISTMDAPNGTIFDRLTKHGITWKDYYPDVPSAALFFPNYHDNIANGKMAPINDFLSDAAAGRLPQFSLVDPYVTFSEESGTMSIGEAYAARVIDAVLQSPNWAKTALFWVYDEHGGWYDHVAPQPVPKPDNVPPSITVPPDQPGAYDYTGFRVPCVVVSPFAKKDFVSHVVYTHTSILKFVETKWNLPAMTYRDANVQNMTDFFDFKGKPAFADPPTLAKPLNPFVGALPSGSLNTADKALFHQIGKVYTAATLPAPANFSSTPPKNGAKLIAADSAAALRKP